MYWFRPMLTFLILCLVTIWEQFNCTLCTLLNLLGGTGPDKQGFKRKELLVIAFIDEGDVWGVANLKFTIIHFYWFKGRRVVEKEKETEREESHISGRFTHQVPKNAKGWSRPKPGIQSLSWVCQASSKDIGASQGVHVKWTQNMNHLWQGSCMPNGASSSLYKHHAVTMFSTFPLLQSFMSFPLSFESWAYSSYLTYP